MPRPIRLVTDSSSDISLQEAQALDIDLVPLSVTVGSRTFAETELSRDEYFSLAHGQPVKTSQPPAGSFRQVFQHWGALGYQVLCITISSTLSGTLQSASQAAEDLPYVTIYDSQVISRMQAAQVLAAKSKIDEGAELSVVLETLDSIRRRSHMLVELNTLERLRQGGRAAAFMQVFDRFARTLQIKPVITLINGELKFAHVVRTFRRGTEYMLQELAAFGPAAYVAVVHTRLPELAERFADELAALVKFPRLQAIVCEAGAVIASHGGEGLLGAIVISAD